MLNKLFQNFYNNVKIPTLTRQGLLNKPTNLFPKLPMSITNPKIMAISFPTKMRHCDIWILILFIWIWGLNPCLCCKWKLCYVVIDLFISFIVGSEVVFFRFVAAVEVYLILRPSTTSSFRWIRSCRLRYWTFYFFFWFFIVLSRELRYS